MAEAVVDERAPLPPRFYCHMCSMEINIPNTDYTCPHCAGGFVEELPALPNAASTSTTSLNDGGGSGADMLNLNRLVDLDAIRGEIETLLMSRNGPIEIAIGPSSRRGNIHLGSGGAGSGAGGGPAGGRVHPANMNSLDNVLIDFLQSLSSGDDGAPLGNPQMFFMGNPGDYAWGREGIDTIVTQLLNQMETSGPPPLAKEKIEEIPKVHVSAEDVERKLQCSVCWEDFRLNETVRKLPCAHIYHENCIVPWLDLHGTCPICRKSLSDEEETHEEGSAGANGGGGGGGGSTTTPIAGNAAEAADGRVVGGRTTATNASTGGPIAGTGNGSSNNTGTSSTSQTQNQSNNVFGFDDSAVDLD